MAYATYEFYTNTYEGTLSESLFDKKLAIVTPLIESITGGAANYAEARNMTVRLAAATCECIDELDQLRQTEKATQHGKIASENNDGFSISYNTNKKGDAVLSGMREICKRYLTYPYNLMYGGR